MSIFYIDIDMAVRIHEKTIQVSGGGELGQLDIGRLASVLEHIQNDDYYPTFIEKLVHLVFCANKFHCFQDGNKRIAISLGIQFLNLNGYLYCIEKFTREMENISYYVAAGKIGKDLLGRIIHSIIYEPDFSEQLKLEILECISNDNPIKEYGADNVLVTRERYEILKKRMLKILKTLDHSNNNTHNE